ncbi:hypothetical protein F5141DRAFT_560082 [Pisolithus sp. B1]|nr:hypothetical protein F5141DRAFT_560082 [Pisolithus sp. B1]
MMSALSPQPGHPVRVTIGLQTQAPCHPTYQVIRTPNYPPAPTGKDGVHCCIPPLRQPFTKSSLHNLIYMLIFLDHPGFIKCSLKATQHHCETNIDKWKKFWMMFQQDISNINLLATMLLAGNANFLNTTTMDGLSYWPQKLSYASLMAASGSILVGLAVQNPRIFTAYSSFYFQTMVLVLGFPFELFLYSIILFIAALIVHLAIHSAKVQIYAAVTIMGLVIVSLFFYWLITELLDGWQFSPQKCKTQRVEGSLQTV